MIVKLPLLPELSELSNVIAPASAASMYAVKVPASPLYAKLLNVLVSVVAPALLFVILVTLEPAETVSSVLLSENPCAALGLVPLLLSANVIVFLSP